MYGAKGEINMTARLRNALTITVTAAAIGFASIAAAAPPPPAKGCPQMGWAEGLNNFLKPDHAFPTEDTRNVPTPDCNFHQWSWEAFVWATALIKDSASGTTVPQFMTLATPAELLDTNESAGEPKVASTDARRPFACIPWRRWIQRRRRRHRRSRRQHAGRRRTAIRSMPPSI